MSFTAKEKEDLKLRGLYPAGSVCDFLKLHDPKAPHPASPLSPTGGPHSLEVKLENLMSQLRLKVSPLEKYIFLHSVQDSDETLYYAGDTTTPLYIRQQCT